VRPAFSVSELSRIIEMAWEDRTPFEAIEQQFGLNEPKLVALMRVNMKSSSFKLWRKRVKCRVTKHSKLRSPAMNGGARHQAHHRIPQR
jgi:uncharacterized protein (TIGR03643 family)